MSIKSIKQVAANLYSLKTDQNERLWRDVVNGISNQYNKTDRKIFYEELAKWSQIKAFGMAANYE